MQPIYIHIYNIYICILVVQNVDFPRRSGEVSSCACYPDN